MDSLQDFKDTEHHPDILHVDRRWTIGDVGRALRSHAQSEQTQLSQIRTELDKVRDRNDELFKILLIGNGTPSLREQLRTHDKWISNVNKGAWFLATAVIAQIIIFACSLVVLIVGFLFQSGYLGP